MPSSWLPPLYENKSGDFQEYLDSCYGIFTYQLKKGNLTLNGKILVLRKEPITLGKENGFWHLIQKRDGSKRIISEDNRIPCFERMKRLVWIRPIILALENENKDKVFVWKSQRPGENKTLISLIDYSYVVVIDHKPKLRYDILLTAYDVFKWKRGDLKKEHEAYLLKNNL